MGNVDKIQEAEANVQKVQDALSAVQAGLARAERVAVAADEARQRSDLAIKAVAVLAGLVVVLLVVSRRRAKR